MELSAQVVLNILQNEVDKMMGRRVDMIKIHVVFLFRLSFISEPRISCFQRFLQAPEHHHASE